MIRHALCLAVEARSARRRGAGGGALRETRTCGGAHGGHGVTPDISIVKFDGAGLVPCVVQERDTGEVLMLAYMNRESLQKTIDTGYTWFWSRSRQELWNKGATSGHLQRVVRLLYDCDGDTLLAVVEQTGPACHTGTHSCFTGRVLIEEA